MHRVQGRPQVVAHRGASHDNPEHTLGAYVAALDAGAEALECDVRLTADGHLVCVHDRTVDRTTDGRGVVSTMELAQLDELDFASWKNPWADLDDEAPEIAEDTRRVLTLRRLVETVRDYPRPVDLAIETKHPTRYAGLVERRLVDLLDSVGWAGADSPARVMSFSPVALSRVERLAPELEVVLLIDGRLSWKVATGVLGPGWIAGPGIELLRESPKLADGCAAGAGACTCGRSTSPRTSTSVCPWESRRSSPTTRVRHSPTSPDRPGPCRDPGVCAGPAPGSAPRPAPGSAGRRRCLAARTSGTITGDPRMTREPSTHCEEVVASTVSAPVTLRLPFAASSVSVARQRLRSWMLGVGGSPEAVEDARIIISELVANAVRHARPLADGSLLVTWGLDGDGVEMSVTDGGASTRPRNVHAPPTALAGRGMAIVDALAKEWWTEAGRSRSTVHAQLSV